MVLWKSVLGPYIWCRASVIRVLPSNLSSKNQVPTKQGQVLPHYQCRFLAAFFSTILEIATDNTENIVSEGEFSLKLLLCTVVFRYERHWQPPQLDDSKPASSQEQHSSIWCRDQSADEFGEICSPHGHYLRGFLTLVQLEQDHAHHAEGHDTWLLQCNTWPIT